MTKTQTEKEKAIAELRKELKPGDTVYTKLLHCAKSGMMRIVDVIVIRDNEPLRYTWAAAKAAGFSYNTKHEGIRVDGCGMDVGFEVVYNLSHVLFPDGFKCIGYEARCPSNDHSNDYMDNKGKSREELYSTERVHKSGGYALRHRWL